MPKELSTFSDIELLALILQEADTSETEYILEEIVYEYIRSESADMGWMGMNIPIEKALMAVVFSDTDIEVKEYSNVNLLSEGILHSVYERAMKDCAVMLGISDAVKFKELVLDFAGKNNYGRDGNVKPAFNFPELIAAVKAFE